MEDRRAVLAWGSQCATQRGGYLFLSERRCGVLVCERALIHDKGAEYCVHPRSHSSPIHIRRYICVLGTNGETGDINGCNSSSPPNVNNLTFVFCGHRYSPLMRTDPSFRETRGRRRGGANVNVKLFTMKISPESSPPEPSSSQR